MREISGSKLCRQSRGYKVSQDFLPLITFPVQDSYCYPVYLKLILEIVKPHKTKDVIYPLRIARGDFKRAQEIAERMDLSASQLIRAALREKITNDDNKRRQEKAEQ